MPLRMSQGHDEGIGADDEDGKNLHTEKARIAGEQAVGAGGVDGGGREDTEQDRSHDAADAVRRPHVEGVVPLHVLHELDGVVADRSGQEADDERRPGGDVAGTRRDAGQTGDRAGECADEARLAVDLPGDEQPGAHGDGAGDVGVHEGLRGDAVGRQSGAPIEAEPAEPEEGGAEADEGDVVRDETLTLGESDAGRRPRQKPARPCRRSRARPCRRRSRVRPTGRGSRRPRPSG